MELIPVVYILHSGQLYGTERMAIKTAKGLRHQHLSIILAPPGAIIKAAAEQGVSTTCYTNYRDLVRDISFYLCEHQKLVFATTSVSQSILVMLCNLFFKRQIVHLHIVHGGSEEHLSYARKSLLNNLPIKLIAVSNYVKERLEIHKVNPQKIKVIENFLLASEVERIPQRLPFSKPGINRVIIVSRLDPIKRISLLFEALDSFPQLNQLKFSIFGFGKDLEKIKQRASLNYPQVRLKGFSHQIYQAMANSDLLLHLCPVEPFGLAILEAMAVGLPVLVANQGGTKTLIENGVSGFQFDANDKSDLAHSLLKLQQLSPELLNSVVGNARATLKNDYTESKGVDAYLQLIDFD